MHKAGTGPAPGLWICQKQNLKTRPRNLANSALKSSHVNRIRDRKQFMKIICADKLSSGEFWGFLSLCFLHPEQQNKHKC